MIDVNRNGRATSRLDRDIARLGEKDTSIDSDYRMTSKDYIKIFAETFSAFIKFTNP